MVIFAGDFHRMLESIGKLHDSQRGHWRVEERQGKSTVWKKTPGEKRNHGREKKGRPWDIFTSPAREV